MLEIRWHSRAGQGAVTGAKALCEVMAEDGKYVQAFSVYGAEKRGAPMHAFNRISDEKIIDHSKSMLPDYVLVIDPSLVYTNVTYDAKPNTQFIITTRLSKEELIKEVPDLVGKNVNVVDCIKISQETIKRAIPNTPMLGAFVKVSKILDIDSFSASMGRILKKFPQKVIDGNLQAIRRAYDEVN
ncbi:MAG: pyruvate flavodoxin oxidoreductase subunit gamma [Helicobacteraceae bacterium]|jgi:pyruvate ferredoxin oxidoreductase gamma subunit|nr:pyruvate flavodoxin oxidoreductase subunit gamma [Helicobacteraceae bacterium]